MFLESLTTIRLKERILPNVFRIKLNICILSAVSEIELGMSANDAIKVLIFGHDKSFISAAKNSPLF